MRAVAREAGVDPALVHHYFAGKSDLFVASLELGFSPTERLRESLLGPRDRLGGQLMAFVLSMWDDVAVQPSLLAVLRSSTTTPDAAALLRDGLLQTLMGELAAAAQPRDPDLMAALVVSQVAGVILARYVLRVEPLASMSAARVTTLIGPTVQRYLDL